MDRQFLDVAAGTYLEQPHGHYELDRHCELPRSLAESLAEIRTGPTRSIHGSGLTTEIQLATVEVRQQQSSFRIKDAPFALHRVRPGHHIYSRPEIGELLNIQEVRTVLRFTQTN